MEVGDFLYISKMLHFYGI